MGLIGEAGFQRDRRETRVRPRSQDANGSRQSEATQVHRRDDSPVTAEAARQRDGVNAELVSELPESNTLTHTVPERHLGLVHPRRLRTRVAAVPYQTEQLGGEIREGVHTCPTWGIEMVLDP